MHVCCVDRKQYSRVCSCAEASWHFLTDRCRLYKMGKRPSGVPFKSQCGQIPTPTSAYAFGIFLAPETLLLLTLGLPRLPLPLKPPREPLVLLVGEPWRWRSCWSSAGALLLPYRNASCKQDIVHNQGFKASCKQVSAWGHCCCHTTTYLQTRSMIGKSPNSWARGAEFAKAKDPTGRAVNWPAGNGVQRLRGPCTSLHPPTHNTHLHQVWRQRLQDGADISARVADLCECAGQ